MIVITRDEQKVKINLKSGVLGYTYEFTWNCNDVVYAEMLKEAFLKQLGDEIERARRESYEQGWKDAKAKRAKSTWFKRWFR